MTTPKDGGPAFPTALMSNGPHEYGMSLRDWFAGMALQGLLAAPSTSGNAEQFAGVAYCHADAMLAEREKKP